MADKKAPYPGSKASQDTALVTAAQATGVRASALPSDPPGARGDTSLVVDARYERVTEIGANELQARLAEAQARIAESNAQTAVSKNQHAVPAVELTKRERHHTWRMYGAGIVVVVCAVISAIVPAAAVPIMAAAAGVAAAVVGAEIYIKKIAQRQE